MGSHCAEVTLHKKTWHLPQKSFRQTMGTLDWTIEVGDVILFESLLKTNEAILCCRQAGFVSLMPFGLELAVLCQAWTCLLKKSFGLAGCGAMYVNGGQTKWQDLRVRSGHKPGVGITNDG